MISNEKMRPSHASCKTDTNENPCRVVMKQMRRTSIDKTNNYLQATVAVMTPPIDEGKTHDPATAGWKEILEKEEKGSWANFDNIHVTNDVCGSEGDHNTSNTFEEPFESSVNWDGHWMSSEPDDDDNRTEDAWIGQLFEENHNRVSEGDIIANRNNLPTTPSRRPILAANHRDQDNGYYGRYYDYYQGSTVGERHLSNEEWILYRRRREHMLRRRQRQQQQLQTSPSIVGGNFVFSYHRSSHGRLPLPYTSRSNMLHVEDGDILLTEMSTEQQQRRFRPRQIQTTANARRERIGHRSWNLITSSYRLFTFPLRRIVRSSRRLSSPPGVNQRFDQATASQGNNNAVEETRQEDSNRARIARTLSFESTRHMESNYSDNDDSHEEWDILVPGWRLGEEEEEIDYYDDSSSRQSVAYWSTGTAMETISSSSCTKSDSTECNFAAFEEHCENEHTIDSIVQFYATSNPVQASD